jgi:hypothetical protein
MSTARIRIRGRGTRARWEPTQADLRRSLVLLACMSVVFAGFFELGHSTRATRAVPQVYVPQTLPAGSVHAGIPHGLIATPAIPSLVRYAVSRHPRRSSHPAVAAAPVTAPTVAAVPAPPSAPPAPVTPTPSVSPSPAPTPAPPASPSPARAPAPSSSPAGGHGSFDSSG